MTKKKSKVNILILYTNYGSGHFSCAKEIESILSLEENIDLQVKNVHRIQSPKITSIIEKGYNNFFTHNAGNKFINNLYGILFYFANNISFVRYFCVQKTGAKTAQKIISDNNIDIVILTYPHYLKTTIPCIVNLTDYGYSKAWKLKKNDIYLINNKDDINKLIKEKVDKNNIYLSKIPLSSKFDLTNNSTKISSVLINLGARGQGKYQNIIDNIKKLSDKNLNIGIMVGKNQELYNKLIKEFSDLTYINIYPFSNNVYDIIAKYDIIVTKAGGLSISECIQTERPIIVNLSQTLKGQEYLNFEYIIDNNIGVGIEEDKIYLKVFEYLEEEDKYKKQVKNIKELKEKINSQKNLVNIVKDVNEKRANI